MRGLFIWFRSCHPFCKQHPAFFLDPAKLQPLIFLIRFIFLEFQFLVASVDPSLGHVCISLCFFFMFFSLFHPYTLLEAPFLLDPPLLFPLWIFHLGKIFFNRRSEQKKIGEASSWTSCTTFTRNGWLTLSYSITTYWQYIDNLNTQNGMFGRFMFGGSGFFGSFGSLEIKCRSITNKIGKAHFQSTN